VNFKFQFVVLFQIISNAVIPTKAKPRGGIFAVSFYTIRRRSLGFARDDKAGDKVSDKPQFCAYYHIFLIIQNFLPVVNCMFFCFFGKTGCDGDKKREKAKIFSKIF
jgi:hypothetical protein